MVDNTGFKYSDGLRYSSLIVGRREPWNYFQNEEVTSWWNVRNIYCDSVDGPTAWDDELFFGYNGKQEGELGREICDVDGEFCAVTGFRTSPDYCWESCESFETNSVEID